MNSIRLKQLQFIRNLYTTGYLYKTGDWFFFSKIIFPEKVAAQIGMKDDYEFCMNIVTGDVYKYGIEWQNGNLVKSAPKRMLKEYGSKTEEQKKAAYIMVTDPETGTGRKVNFQELWATFVCPELLDFIIAHGSKAEVEFHRLVVNDLDSLVIKHKKPQTQIQTQNKRTEYVYKRAYSRNWQIAVLVKQLRSGELGGGSSETIDPVAYAKELFLNGFLKRKLVQETLPIWVITDLELVDKKNSLFSKVQTDKCFKQLLMIESYKYLYECSEKVTNIVTELTDPKHFNEIEFWLTDTYNRIDIESRDREKRRKVYEERRKKEEERVEKERQAAEARKTEEQRRRDRENEALIQEIGKRVVTGEISLDRIIEEIKRQKRG